MAQDAGKIYVRLVLDDEKYKQALTEDIKNTEATVKNMARIWAFLGAKTDEYYQNQIKGAKNAYTYIQAAHKDSINEILRAEEAKVAKINAINKQMASSLAYSALGIRPAKEINADIEGVLAMYNLAKKAAGDNQAELVRIEAAKNAKLKELTTELNKVKIDSAKATAEREIQIATNKYQRIMAITEAEISNQKHKVREAQALSQNQINAQQKAENERVRIAQLQRETEAANNAYLIKLRQERMQAAMKASQAELNKQMEVEQLIAKESLHRYETQQKAIQNAPISTTPTKSPWQTLGIRSIRDIEKQKQEIINATNDIQSIVAKGSQDWVNAERTKNEKLKALNKEMVGDHEMSMAAMMRAVLRLYATYYVMSNIAQYLVKPFVDGFKAVEEYNTSVASLAAMMVTFNTNQENASLETKWKNALQYSSSMVPVLEQIAAKTLLSGQETIALANAFARSGVFIEQNNKLQLDAFTNISNALPLMTQGQEIMRQINTEVRSLMTGANEQSSMLLLNLKAINPNIEKDLKLWRAQGTVLEHIGDLLQGFAPATAILEYQWMAVKSTIQTTYDIIMRDIMADAYKNIIAQVKSLNDWLLKSKDNIVMFSDVGVGAIKAITAAVSLMSVAFIVDAIPSIINFTTKYAGLVATFSSSHPIITGIAVAIGAITFAFNAAAAAADKADRAQRSYVKSIQEMNLSSVNKQLGEQESKLKSLKNKYNTPWGSSSSTKQEIKETEYLIAVLKSRARVAMDVPDAVQKANNTARNLTKMAEEEARALHKQTKDEFMKDMNDQVAALKKAGASEIAIEKYVAAQKNLYQEKFGKYDTRAAAKATRALQHEEEQILANLTKQNKTYYETIANNAKSAYDLKLKQGENALEASTKLYNEEQKALTDWYNTQAEYINRSFSSERVKQEKLDTLYEEYSKKWDTHANEKARREENYTRKNISVVSNAYKTLGDYSKEATQYEIKQIEAKYKTEQSYVEKGSKEAIVVEKAKNFEIFKLRNESEKKLLDMQLSYLKDLGEEHTKQYRELSIQSINNQADLLEQQFKNANGGDVTQQLESEHNLTVGLQREYLQRLKDRAIFLKGMGDKKGYNAAQDAIKTLTNSIKDYSKEAQNASEKTGNIFDKEAWKKAKKDEFEKQELSDTASYYSQIDGYAEESYLKKLKLIELERQANIKMYGDIGAANAKANQDRIKALTAKIDSEQEWAKTAINNFNDVIDAAKECYAEDSYEYNRLNDIKKGIMIAELAMNAAKNAQIISNNIAMMASTASVATTNAAAAVTGASIGVGPIGFATGAAMLAFVSSILGMVGIAFGSGGGSSASASTPSYTGKSTVLGAADDFASESIDKSYELLQDTYEMEYSELSQLNQSMTELNGNITGLVSSIVRTGNIDGNFNINTGTEYPSWWVGISKSEKWTGVGPLDTILGWLQDLGLGIMNGLFGGKTSTEIQETGIAAAIDGSIRDILSGAMQTRPYEYAITKTTKDGGWFGSDSESYSAYVQPASDQVVTLFHQVWKNMSSSLVFIAEQIGVDVENVLNYKFETWQMNLRGMSGEEINEALSAKFSEMMDIATEELFGNVLYQYQQVGEALYETAVRLVTDKAIVSELMKMTGQQLPKTSSAIIEFSESLINLAGDLDTLKDYFNTYYDKFFSDIEKHNNLYVQLTDSLSSIGYSIPKSRSEFRLLVNSIDKTTEAGQRMFISLLSLAGSADEYYSYLEEVSDSSLSTAKENLEAAYSAEKERLTEAYNVELESINKRLNDAKEALSEITEIVNKLKSAKESMQLTDEASALGMYQFSQKYLQNVLNQARSGDISGIKSEGFDKVLSTLTADNSKYYKTLQEYKEAYYKTYNSINELQDVAVDQEDAAKQTVDLLESQIEILKANHEAQLAALDAQLNALLGISENIMSIGQATAAYKEAQSNAAKASNDASANNGTDIVVSDKESFVKSLYQTYFGREADAAGLAYWTSSQYEGSQLASTILGSAAGTDIDAAVSRGYRSYASGGIASGPVSGYEATLHGTELVVSPRSSYPATIKGNDNAELLAEVKLLRAEIAAVSNEQKKGNRYLRNLDEWNEIGMPVTQAA